MSPLNTIHQHPHSKWRQRADSVARWVTVILLLLLFLHGHGWAQLGNQNSPGLRNVYINYQVIQNAGIAIAARSTLNFTGTGVTCADDAVNLRTTCTITAGAGSAHALLSATHSDTTAHSVVRGDLIAGIGVSPAWTAVAAGGANTYPKWNASADVVASTNPASGTGSPTACSNQFVTALTLNADAVPTSTCTTATLASAQFANQGTTTTVLHGNAAGNPSFGAVTSADTTGTFAPTAHNLLSASHGDTTAAAAVRGDGIFAIGVSPTWQRLAHSLATGGYFKWNGTDEVASTGAAGGTGACTNQVVTAENADAAPTCSTVTSAMTSGIAALIASGTAAMTTAAIAAAACGTTVTVAATGAATTDAIIHSFNAAVTISNAGKLILSSWPTANNVNFNYCNTSAASVTPTAMTLNWRVVR